MRSGRFNRVLRCVGLALVHRDIRTLLAVDRLVRGTDDALARDDFLEAMRSPTRHASAGEQRGEQILRNAQHGVHEAGVHVHVRAHVLSRAFLIEDHLGCQALDLLEQTEFGFEFRAYGQLLGKAFADDGARSDSVYTAWPMP